MAEQNEDSSGVDAYYYKQAYEQAEKLAERYEKAEATAREELKSLLAESEDFSLEEE